MVAPHALGTIHFDGVRVSLDDVLGEVDAGFGVAMRTLDLFRPSVGAFAVGMAQAALEASLAWTTERELFGGRLIDQQATQHTLAEMATRIEAGRLLVRRAAAAYDGGCAAASRSRPAQRRPSCSRPRRPSGWSTRRSSCTVHGDSSAGTCSSGSIVRSGAADLRGCLRGAADDHRPRTDQGERVTRYRASAGITDDWQHFDFAVADGVATVTLNRPEKMNPLTFESYADLRDLLAELPHRGDTRVLVIRGEGKGFCGGGDVNEIIGELIQMDAAGLMGFTKMTGDMIRAMRECPIPIIAGIQGIAAGAGQRAGDRRGLPDLHAPGEVRVPLHQGRAVRRRHGRGVPPAAARRLRPRHRAAHARRHHRRRDRRPLRPGHPAPGRRADLDDACAALARRLADGPTLGLQQTKSLITRELDMPLGPAMELDAMTQALLMTTHDHAEFHAAFNAKRKPDWKGR